MNTEWWEPQTLNNSQQEFREINEISELDAKCDFGSYRRVLLGDDLKAAQLQSHSDLDPIFRIKFCEKFIKKNDKIIILDADAEWGLLPIYFRNFIKNRM